MRTRTKCSVVLPFLGGAGLVFHCGARALSQELLWHQDGPAGQPSSSNYGEWVGPGPDLDGDGVGEVMVGAPFHDKGRGALFLYAGVDGTYLERIDGADGFAKFGHRHAFVSDRDGNGIGEFLVGAPEDSSVINRSGRVYLYSGTTREVIHAFDPDANQEGLSRGILFPDWNGDGIEDYVVTAPYFPQFGPFGLGYVRVFSGVDYSELWTEYGQDDDYHLGTDIACAGDTDGDGVSDLIAGASRGGGDGRGEAYVYSGRTHAILQTLRGSTGDVGSFGAFVAAPGDLDGDGFADVLVSAYCSSDCRGEVYLFSGKSGSELHRWDGVDAGDVFGNALAVVGDLNGDGYSEILVGANGEDADRGAAHLYSGRTRRILYVHRGSNPHGPTKDERLGRAARGLSDVDGDGICDYVISANWHRNVDDELVGGAFVFAGNDFWLQGSCEQCTEGDIVELYLRGGEPDAFALLAVVAVDGTPLFRPVTFAKLDSNGDATFTTTIPAGLSGLSFSLKAWSTRTTTQGPPKDSGTAKLRIL